jgi:hypothetical protein
LLLGILNRASSLKDREDTHFDYCHLRDGERARQGRPSLVFGDSALTFYGATARFI